MQVFVKNVHMSRLVNFVHLTDPLPWRCSAARAIKSQRSGGDRSGEVEKSEARDQGLGRLHVPDTCASDGIKLPLHGAESVPQPLLLDQASRPAPLPIEPTTSLNPFAFLASADLGFVSGRPQSSDDNDLALPQPWQTHTHSSDDVALPQPSRPFSAVAAATSPRLQSPTSAETECSAHRTFHF